MYRSKILRVRYLLVLLILIVGLHLIVAANKTYQLGNKIYDKDQYHLYISSTPIEDRHFYVMQTNVTYFDDYPESILNIFYGTELVISLIILVMYMIKPVKEKETIKSEAVEKLQDLMLEIGVATAHGRHKLKK